jgi:hypothetical protein
MKSEKRKNIQVSNRGLMQAQVRMVCSLTGVQVVLGKDSQKLIITTPEADLVITFWTKEEENE